MIRWGVMSRAILPPRSLHEANVLALRLQSFVKVVLTHAQYESLFDPMESIEIICITNASELGA